MPEIDLRVVHLVRDSRGVAYSTNKHVEKVTTSGPSTLLPRYGPVSSSARYDFYNGVTSALRATGVPYLRLRYEDLIAEPRDPELPFLKRAQVDLAENHLVDGIPIRFAHDPLQLCPDEEWRQVMPTRSRRTVTALTLPLLTRYGYRPNGGHRRTRGTSGRSLARAQAPAPRTPASTTQEAPPRPGDAVPGEG